MFALRNYRSLTTGAYTASLWYENTRVATVEDSGQGGQPTLRLTKNSLYSDEETLRDDLAIWAERTLPEWYLTTFGTHGALRPSWDLALSYLTEVMEYNRLAKTGRLARKADGTLWRVPADYQPHDVAVWANGTWVAA